MDTLNMATFVAPTEEELLAECPDQLFLNDADDALANDIILL
ncbi:hypothetical protein [Photobacterium sanctipauli]|nr:hypothetical protein [Photobacterium sanctipauli]